MQKIYSAGNGESKILLIRWWNSENVKINIWCFQREYFSNMQLV